MAYKLEVNYPDLHSGEELFMPGLPVVLKNGSTVELSDEDAATFENVTGTKVKDAFPSGSSIKLTTAKSGGDK